MKTYSNYGEYALDFCNKHGLKVHTVDNKNYEQLPNLATIYINRIGDKTRIIEDTTTMRNLICVSFDTDKWQMSFLKHRINSYKNIIDQTLRHGTCQMALRSSELRQVLAGVMDYRNTYNRALLNEPIPEPV